MLIASRSAARIFDFGDQFGDPDADLNEARRTVSNWASRQNDAFGARPRRVSSPIRGGVDQQPELVGVALVQEVGPRRGAACEP